MLKGYVMVKNFDQIWEKIADHSAFTQIKTLKLTHMKPYANRRIFCK